MARVSGFSRYLAGGILGINLAAVAAALYLLDNTQLGEEQKFRIEAATLVHLITQDIEREYAGVDLSLQVIADEQVSQGARDRGQLEAWLERVRRWHPALSFLRITDAEGNVLPLPADAGRRRPNIAQHDYFVRLRGDPQAGLQITPPLTDHTSGETVLIFARRLADSDGRFAGVALASIPVAHFAEMFAHLDLQAGVRIGLFDSRHGWILRHPAQGNEAEDGRNTLAEPLRQAMETMPGEGFFDAVSDGVDRSIAYRYGREFDFYVVLDQRRDVYLSHLAEMEGAVAVVLTVFALLTAAFGLVLYRSWKQQASLMAQLLEHDLWIRQAEQVGALGLYWIDIDADCWTATEAFDRMTGIAAGYPRTSEDWLALIHPDDRDAVSDSFRRAAAARREVVEVECRIIRPSDGAVRWISSVAQLVPLTYGLRHAIVGVAHDITVSKCAADQLRRSEQLFRGVFDTSLIGMVMTSPDRHLLAVNQAACDMLGRTREELLGMDWLEVSHPDDCSANLEALRRVVAGQTDAYDLEKRYFRKDGTIIDAYIAARALRGPDGTIEHIVTLLQDVTARKRVERMLRQSEADLRAAFAGAAVGIAFVAPNGAWLSVNDRLCEIVGYTKNELLALSFQDITYPDDLPGDVAQVARMLAREIERYSLEKRYVRKDGDVIWINLSVSLVLNDDGTPHHFVSIVEDIDARKRAERDLRRSRELLQSFLDHLPDSPTSRTAPCVWCMPMSSFASCWNWTPNT
jgi:PAS domain S-box-containing protein